MFLIVILALFGIIFIWYSIPWLKKRKIIMRIPGPSGMLSTVGYPADELWNFYRRSANNYYPIYRYWYVTVPVVNILCPEDMEIVLSSTKHSSKSVVYTVLHPWLGTGLLTSQGTKWQHRRKILTNAFHFNILQEFIGTFVEETKLLIEELEEECFKPYTDVESIIGRFTLHTICETAMGTKLEKTEKNSQDYTKFVFSMGKILVKRILTPWYIPDIIYRFTSLYREQQIHLKILHSFTRNVIEKRKATFDETILLNEPTKEGSVKKRRLAMLDLLISAKNSGQFIDDEGIREEVDTFMFEGHDTTSSCICFTLLLLACYPDIQAKIVDEVEEILGDSNGAPTIQDLQKLVYLERVLKESLRIYPSVPYISRVSKEDIHTHSGYTIPANTTLQIHIYDLHHNPKIYPNPEIFDPDRFLPENVQKMHPFAYIPFSAGPRNCIGQKFALLEIKIAISAILRKFVLEPIDFPSSLTLITHIVMKNEGGIRIKFQKRF